MSELLNKDRSQYAYQFANGLKKHVKIYALILDLSLNIVHEKRKLDELIAAMTKESKKRIGQKFFYKVMMWNHQHSYFKACDKLSGETARLLAEVERAESFPV